MLNILTAIYKRRPLTLAWIEYYSQLTKRLPLRLHVVISDNDADLVPVLDAASIAWTIAPNEPVSLKWQAGVALVQKQSPDSLGLMILGSDDFATEQYIAGAIGELESGRTGGWGLQGCHFLDAQTGRFGFWTGCHRICKPNTIPAESLKLPLGAGRIFSRALLEKLDWRLWKNPQNRALDMACTKFMAERGCYLDVTDDKRINVVDIKTGQNIHHYSALVGLLKTVKLEALDLVGLAFLKTVKLTTL